MIEKLSELVVLGMGSHTRRGVHCPVLPTLFGTVREREMSVEGPMDPSSRCVGCGTERVQLGGAGRDDAGVVCAT